MVANIYAHLRKKKASYDFHTRLQQGLRSPEILLVHQMGKVGSSAIVASLEALSLDIPVFHTHSLNLKEIEKRLRRTKEAGRELEVGHHLITSQYIQKNIAQSPDKKSWKVITLVREPITRNISAFFQNINIFFPDLHENYGKGSIGIDQVIETFLKEYIHDLPLRWLDVEIKDVFGVDVFSTPFPTSIGYQTFHHKNLQLLVIRLEDLNHCFQTALQEFMNIESIELKQENVAADKSYNAIYQEFRNKIVLPEWYVEKMYSSKYMRHFYTENEIDRFRRKWSTH